MACVVSCSQIKSTNVQKTRTADNLAKTDGGYPPQIALGLKMQEDRPEGTLLHNKG